MAYPEKKSKLIVPAHGRQRSTETTEMADSSAAIAAYAKEAGVSAIHDTVGFQPYDHEVKQLDHMLRTVVARYTGRMRDVETMHREIIDRALEIGLVVTVVIEQDVDTGVVWPSIEIVGRAEKTEFDHERQHHEVVHDLLGLDEGGMIPVPHKIDRPGHHH